ncbi:acyl-CoA dehydrogenase family protein [Frankia sp. CNm7]|nr:acyl-CoA dehydrogenase family protein [Frankia nepalensis]MBL7510586.1 acyl-CoA dehydrogenase family protein [Frankia nepalensis]MBL7517326.1 acyl-CoA dehydrogenase family protein [Frankia nepalensis]
MQYSPSINADLVGRARDLRPLIAANAARVELDRQLPEATVGALTEAGLLKLTVPRRYGGHETNFATYLAVSAEIARACGSTAWVTALINICNWAVCAAPDKAREDVFGADPDARVCGVLAPGGTATPTGDGYRVSGSWGFTSGSPHATWAVVGVQVANGGRAVEFGNVLMPMAELTIKDTWHVAGMRGTGSNTVVAQDVFVPAHRFIRLSFGGDQPDNHPDEPLYRSSMVPSLALVLAGPQLGLARAALDHTLATIGKRGISYTFYDHAVEAPFTQFQIAQATELIDTAALHVFRSAAHIDQAAIEGRAMEITERLRVRMDTGYAITRCRQAIDLLLDANGASSFAESNPLQRIWRDSSVAARHAIASPSVSAEAYGRAVLGVEEQMTLVI